MTKVSIIFDQDNKPMIITTNQDVAQDTHFLLCRYYPTHQWVLKTWTQDQIIDEVPQELMDRYNREFEEEEDSDGDYESESDEDSDE